MEHWPCIDIVFLNILLWKIARTLDESWFEHGDFMTLKFHRDPMWSYKLPQGMSCYNDFAAWYRIDLWYGTPIFFWISNIRKPFGVVFGWTTMFVFLNWWCWRSELWFCYVFILRLNWVCVRISCPPRFHSLLLSTVFLNQFKRHQSGVFHWFWWSPTLSTTGYG